MAELRRVFLGALILYGAWCLFYIFRTSFVVDGQRVFVLWDDGMVSMRYARNLALGHGLVWNAAGERVQGYSNLGVTLVMAAVHLLPLDRTKTSLVVQLLNAGLLVYLALAARAIGRRLFGHGPVPDVTAIAVLSCPPLALLALQGTDVAATSAIVMAALSIVCATPPGERWPDRVYLVLAAGILLRLDFIPVYCAFAACSLAFERSRGSLLVAAGTLAATTVSILGWQLWYYNDALPNTYYLKLAGQPMSLMLRQGILTQGEFLLHASVSFAVAAWALTASQRKDRRIWLLGALIAVFIAYNVRAGGDWIEHEGYPSRMLAPALPLIVIAIVGAWWRVFERFAPNATAAFAILAVVSAVNLSTESAVLEWINPRHQPLLREYNRINVARAFYLARHTSPDATLAVHAAGTTPYFLDRPTIDVLGKSDAHIAHLVVDRFFAGHSKWDWAYILEERRPDLFDGDSRGLVDLPEFTAHYERVEAGGVEFIARRDVLARWDDPGLKILPLKPEE